MPGARRPKNLPGGLIPGRAHGRGGPIVEEWSRLLIPRDQGHGLALGRTAPPESVPSDVSPVMSRPVAR